MMSFPSASFLMFHQQLLTVLGIPFLVYTGEMTPAARHKVLKEFQAQHAYVLIHMAVLKVPKRGRELHARVLAHVYNMPMYPPIFNTAKF